ncbi:MAG: hypothetical protein IJ555_09080, partial [Ruminococcus sp.]|nr:hypothetical protein [Ruminococcus sp.]
NGTVCGLHNSSATMVRNKTCFALVLAGSTLKGWRLLTAKNRPTQPTAQYDSDSTPSRKNCAPTNG